MKCVILAWGPCKYSLYHSNFSICAAEVSTWMNFFPCQISLSRTSKTMLNRSDDSGHSCLVLDLVLDPFSSVAQSCPTLCNPVDCSMLGLPVHHQLLKFAQTHVHQVGDAIQPSHSLSSPSPTFSLSQHQDLFQ